MRYRIHGRARSSADRDAVAEEVHVVLVCRAEALAPVGDAGLIAARLHGSLAVADPIPVREGSFGAELGVAVLDPDDPCSRLSIPGGVRTTRPWVREA